jgi:hypothetical protein
MRARSIKYHLLHPEYIHGRMRQLSGKFNLCVLLCLVDVEGSTQALEVLPLLLAQPALERDGELN